MKLGVITSLWAYAENLSMVQTLQRISNLGLRHVDLLGILHGNPLELTANEKLAIDAHLQKLDLVVGSLVMLPPGNVASQDINEQNRCLTYLQAGIDWMDALGGKQVLFNAGLRSFNQSHARSWENAVQFIRRVSDYAYKKGIYITIEAEPYVYFLVNDLESTDKMLKAVDHPNCKTVIDIGHMNLSRDQHNSMVPIKDQIIRLHLSENDGILHANDVLGTGTVDFKAYLETLHQLRFEETCHMLGMELVAAMELGVLSTPIPDPDSYALTSLNHILDNAPFLETT